MKLNFIVNKNVLIPREDTEILVLEALKQGKTKILDLCTGSGCIAISLAKYLNNAQVDASDISTRALSVAKKNAKLNDVNVNFIHSDLFESINEKYDLIISNPPYIRKSDIKNLQLEVKKEPMRALDGGESGLDFYERIINESVNFLNRKGIIMFEIGYDQAKDVSSLLKKNNFRLFCDGDEYTQCHEETFESIFPNKNLVVFSIEPGEGEVYDETELLIQINSPCPQHKEKFLMFYCFDCGTSICSECFTNGIHKGHHIQDKCYYLLPSKFLVQKMFESWSSNPYEDYKISTDLTDLKNKLNNIFS